jgi:transposase
LVSLRARISHRLKEHGLSYPAIAAALNRDHTSIMYLIKAYKPTGERV